MVVEADVNQIVQLSDSYFFGGSAQKYTIPFVRTSLSLAEKEIPREVSTYVLVFLDGSESLCPYQYRSGAYVGVRGGGTNQNTFNMTRNCTTDEHYFMILIL